MTEQTTTGSSNPTRPTRPFESLEWYRDATRSGPGGGSTSGRFLDWVRGIGFLSLHVSAYALGIVTMFVANLLRSPDDIWVDRSIPIWTLIVVIHAGVVGLVWAVGMLNRDDDDPIRVVSDASWRQAKTWPSEALLASSTDGEATAPASAMAREPVGAGDSAVARDETVSQPAPILPAAEGATEPAVKWSGWESDVPQRIDPGDPDRASWQEAASAAWRDRPPASSLPAGDSTNPA